jgi:hypothetical protein
MQSKKKGMSKSDLDNGGADLIVEGGLNFLTPTNVWTLSTEKLDRLFFTIWDGEVQLDIRQKETN